MSSALVGPANMCKYSGPVRLDCASRAGVDALHALNCSLKDVSTMGYLHKDQTQKSVYASQLSLSTAEEAASEPEAAPVPRRTFIKGGRARKCWDSGEWALSQHQLSLPVDALASPAATAACPSSAAIAEMECLPRRYWTAPTEPTGESTRRSRFAPAE